MADNRFILRINKKLVDRFGIPKRSNKLPDPLEMIIATILSQNTNDKNSYKAFLEIRSCYKNWDEVINKGQKVLAQKIKTAGLSKQKSDAIINLLVRLKNEYGFFSLNHIKEKNNIAAINELTSFKGVGVKTASCVLLFSFERDICPVDTHVFRTVNRIGVVKEKTPDKTFFALNVKFPPGIAHQFHTNLIRLGREICKPANPACFHCPLKRICRYPQKKMSAAKEYKSNDFFLLDNIS